MILGNRQITHYPLPITHYPLPITHYPLPKRRDGFPTHPRGDSVSRRF
ncbi:hypothetical protein [Fischerella thermalis]